VVEMFGLRWQAMIQGIAFMSRRNMLWATTTWPGSSASAAAWSQAPCRSSSRHRGRPRSL